MGPLPRLEPKVSITLTLESLTPAAFAPFGAVIATPIARHATAVPASLPEARHPRHQPSPQFANQQTALKTSPISLLENNYPPARQTEGIGEAKGLMSMFSCFPRRDCYLDESGKLKLKIGIVERHPFTTQTFCPLNFSDVKKGGSGRTCFLVVVAPTIQNDNSDPKNPPDLSRIRAFVAPTTVDGHEGMAVTYNAGTWHAPMIVLGDRRIDFLVTQFANGHGPDDCQEVLFGSSNGHDKAEVEIDLTTIGMCEDSSNGRPKL